MFMREKNQLQHNRYNKKHLIFAFIAILLLGGAIVWILNSQGIIRGPWASILPVIFTVIGVLITLLQWLLPLSNTALHTPRDSDVSKSDHEPEKSYIRVEGIDLGISKETGALIIYTKKTKLGESVDLRRNHILPLAHSTSNIIQRVINNQRVYAAIFPQLEPSDYIAYDASGTFRTKITVLPNQATEIDWRGSKLSKAAANF